MPIDWRRVLGSTLAGMGGYGPAEIAQLRQIQTAQKAMQPINEAFTGYVPNVNVSPQGTVPPSQGGTFDYGGSPVPRMDSIAPLIGQALARGADPQSLLPFMSLSQMYEPPKPQMPEARVLGEGDILTQGGRTIASNPKPPPEVNYNQPFLPGGAPNPAFQEYQRGLRAAGRPQVNTTVNAGSTFASGLGSKTADVLEQRSSAATGAVQQIDTGNRIMEALDSGKVIAGPGATFRVIGQQIFGSDPEVLQQTRTVIQGLAESTLNARQELKGNGPLSDYEQLTAEKARSGNIDDLTADEIRVLVKANDRLSRIRIRQARDFVQKASKLPGAPEGFVQMFDVEEPPMYQPRQPAPQGAPVRVNSPDEARRLAPGTEFITPDGRRMVR